MTFYAKLPAHLPTTAALGLSTVLAVATLGDKTEIYLQQQHFSAELPIYLPTTATMELPTVYALATLGDTT